MEKANTIDAWLACDRDDGRQVVFREHPEEVNDCFCGTYICTTNGHDIKPGECRSVKLRMEVIECES